MKVPAQCFSAVAFVLITFAGCVFGAALAPATFDEYAAICWFPPAQGADIFAAESISLSIDCGASGRGTATAWTSAVLPVTGETVLELDDLNGVGGSTYVTSQFEFQLVANQPGPPEWVEVHLSAFGLADVSSNGAAGAAFARLTTPWGQFEATNESPTLGWQNGRFEFSVNETFLACSGTTQSLTMYLYSHGQGIGGWDGAMHTLMDPTVTLSGEWADRYQIVWSPGIVQAASVPEPSSVSLWAGLAALAVSALSSRKRLGRASLFVAIAAAGSTGICRAAVLVYGAGFDTLSYTYRTIFDSTESTVEIASSSGYPVFTGDFGTDKQLRVTYSAPPGQKFRINPPLDADFLEFGMWFRSTEGMSIYTGPDGQNWIAGVSVEFTGAEGTLPTLGPTFAYLDTGFWAWSLGYPSGAFAFESVTALYTCPLNTTTRSILWPR